MKPLKAGGARVKTRRAAAAWVLTGCVLAGICCPSASASAADELQNGFARPPDSASPWVNWFWLNGNITRAGITADLEAMQRVGIGGVLIMDVTQDIPPGPVRFGSAEWYEMFQHAVSEAGRLGLEVSINNAPGWTGSGGPWITPELGMQKLVWNKTNLVGPAHFDGPLPRLPTSQGLCRDIATLAFPTLVGDGAPVPGFAPKLTASVTAGFDGAKLLDGNPATFVTLPAPRPGKPQFLQLEFAQPFTAQHLKLTVTEQQPAFEGVLQISEDGRTFRNVREFRSGRAGVSLAFEQVSARYYRVLFTKGDPPLSRIELAEVDLEPLYRIEQHQAKVGLSRWTPPNKPFPNVPPYAVIRPENIVDLTAKTDQSGRLVWEVPKGLWTVLRLGYTPTGTENHAVPVEGSGLECDKLSKEAIEAQFAAFLAKLIAGAGDAAGRAFTQTHIDSWEIGFQNWTPLFREEFRKRRGYDLLPYLPAFSGRIVQSPEVSERFLWDVRRTIADLVADNYAGHLAELAHRHGMKLSLEAYGNGPFDDLLYAARADVPMGEFWMEEASGSGFASCKAMTAAAHTAGKAVVAAEAFTSYPLQAKWQNHPFTLKGLADAVFCQGVNRLVVHRYALQPWLDRRPGMTMGQWGIHYERTQTWWELSKPWHEYLARCQFLLQRGLFVGDLCYVTAEGAYTEAPVADKLQAPLPAGYDYDVAAPDVVLERLSVRDGRLVLPDGMSYRVLVLPPTEFVTPKLLRKIKQLAEAGATILGPRPLRSPSLTDYPHCDAEVKQLADELWGDCDGKAVKEHRAGKGRIVWGKSLADVLAGLGAAPDFQQLTRSPGRPLNWIHRSLDGAEFYFVANPNSQPVAVECAFRVADKRPELWYPDSGRIERVAVWHEEKGRTVVPLQFDPVGSIFVVFRESARGVEPVVALTRNGKAAASVETSVGADGRLQLLATEAGAYELKTASGRNRRAEIKELPRPVEITGKWELRFPPQAGAPEQVTLTKLISWTEHSDPGVKYFSGIATYSRTLQVPAEWLARERRVYLDLGRVQVMAQVKLNGQDLGILWKPPFRVDITEAVKAGENALNVKVVNLWPNRLIGDEHLPDDCQWRPDTGCGCPLVEWPKWLLEGKPSPTGRLTFATWKHWTKDSPLLESGLLGPVTLRVAQRVTVE